MDGASKQHPEIWDRLLEKLQTKYSQTGQELDAYLEGLLYQDYLNYWDYIHTDALLSLQIPRTQYLDEQIFIIYHQITELNFKLILAELAQVSALQVPTEAEILKRVGRVNRYVDNLIRSFDVMSEGMDQDQFLRFRMALLPASGFQSAQFRFIEIACTDGWNLIDKSLRGPSAQGMDAKEVYANMYWRQGATEVGTGQKTLTLRRFEEKYGAEIERNLLHHQTCNLRQQYQKVSKEPSEAVRNVLLTLDRLVNVEWRLVHFKSAVRYLHQQPDDIPATGGTNWKKYLPPNFQLNRFFPELGEFE